MDPLCSVVIPCYNARGIVADTVDKVIAQTYKNIEIIIVDDGSSDGTAQYITERFKLPVITIENSGPAVARNVGIKAAKGEYIALCDADDHWYPEKVEKQVALLVKNPDCGFCFTDVELMRSDRIISTSIKDRYIVYGGNVFDKLLFSNWITTSSVMIAASVIRENVLYFSTDREILNVEDWNYWIRLAYHTRFVYLDEVMVRRFMLADSYGATHADKQFYRIFYNLRSILGDIGYSEAEIRKVLSYRTKYIGANRVFDDILSGRADAARQKIDILRANHCGGPMLALLRMSLWLPLLVVRAMHYWNDYRHYSEVRKNRHRTIVVSSPIKGTG